MTDPPTLEPRVSTPIKCLLVDDLPENLLALAVLLRRPDLELLQARSGPEALEILLAHDVALALVDVQMPDMDGFELAELMRGSQRTRNVPIIFVTAGGRDQHRLFKGYDAGAVDFLFKPIEAEVLRSKVEVFIQLQRQKQQLSDQLNELTETLRLNEMFTAVLSHDLRSPLAAILTTAELLERGPDPAAAVRAATRIKSSGRRMARLIEDTLDLARARLAGGIPLRPAPADLGELVGRVAQELQTAHPDRRIDLQAQGDLAGVWDVDRMAQVASNLIGNAIQHGKGPAIRVALDGQAREQVALSVASAGVIAADVLPHLFNPFRRGQRQRGSGEGLGLGLYIVQQIVQAHRGRVQVLARPEEAETMFRVEVPRHTG